MSWQETFENLDRRKRDEAVTRLIAAAWKAQIEFLFSAQRADPDAHYAEISKENCFQLADELRAALAPFDAKETT